MQSCFHAIDDQGVTRIVTTLETHHTLRTFGQPINEFAFAFVAPLGADHHHMPSVLFTHGLKFVSQ
jgi:hypothetical protein